MPEPAKIVDESSFEDTLSLPRAFIYKYSSRCQVSYFTNREIEEYARDGGRVPVYVMDVIEDRPLSRAIAERLQVRHQSPQVILIENGVATWNASHGDVTSDALRAAAGDA